MKDVTIELDFDIVLIAEIIDFTPAKLPGYSVSQFDDGEQATVDYVLYIEFNYEKYGKKRVKIDRDDCLTETEYIYDKVLENVIEQYEDSIQ